jgi:hypothetical protein
LGPEQREQELQERYTPKLLERVRELIEWVANGDGTFGDGAWHGDQDRAAEFDELFHDLEEHFVQMFTEGRQDRVQKGAAAAEVPRVVVGPDVGGAELEQAALDAAKSQPIVPNLDEVVHTGGDRAAAWVNALRKHNEENPTHGVGCICMDSFARELRQMFPSPNAMGVPDKEFNAWLRGPENKLRERMVYIFGMYARGMN